mmetsp:Transcript_26378/g.79103  ORF Transcript_26378/g.79103 Transcript_26378/m.79103 type:complete len:293 (+) Transcript_26378:139-1017(+)
MVAVACLLLAFLPASALNAGRIFARGRRGGGGHACARADARLGLRHSAAPRDDDPWALAANATGSFVEGAEGLIRSATGNQDYKFGDLTKGTVEATVRAATGDEQYQFGDMTKSAIESLSGKAASEYEFGDITRKALTDAERQLESWRDEYFRNVPKELQRVLLKDLSPADRERLIDAIGGWGAVCVLSWALLSSAFMGLRVAVAWAATARGPERWARCLRGVATLRIAEVVLLPAKALLLCVAVPRFNRASERIQSVLPERPYRRALAAVLAYLAGAASVGLATAGVLLVV